MMDKERQNTVSIQRTTLDPSIDEVEMGVWVPPIECEGCNGRVDTFYRYNQNDEARCSGCGSDWEIVNNE